MLSESLLAVYNKSYSRLYQTNVLNYYSGRILCDLKVTAREFIKGVNYEMDELVDSQVCMFIISRNLYNYCTHAIQLKQQRIAIEPEEIPRHYR